MKQSDCFKTFFLVGAGIFPSMGCFEIYTFVLKETTALPLGISRRAEAPAAVQGLVPALCEPGALLSEGSWQGTFSNPFKTFVGCQSKAEGLWCNGNPVPREEM